MSPTESTQFLLLDNDGRPLRRVAADDGWRRVVRELLELDSQWLVIEQRRFDDQAPVPRWDDIRLSRTISRRLRPMDVKLADHVIRGSGDQFSFRAAGLL
ncbi:DNA repair protein RadC [Sphingobium herbicidovorans NBRC 16415]|uniref:DNA repair protein RadC n=1 Tax=Sphingobium herbicidovorans (strain ATCC 700291 / DSM 11019 / CCUG 56400 / KCTC 2939 / LMG 18315 / NBRC 16415 / MH) TaxID=1219045 RepID=A0A086PCI8_SPHHM|nr:JAB domain-containing protein [Sphingobium herbicidovorans]KFG91106.1 DNA repair protein RadC [Sphingobium herbicidovorans NBRC 16415]